MVNPISYYEILGINENSDSKTILKSYKREILLAKLNQKKDSNKVRIQEVTEAYNILINPETKFYYKDIFVKVG